ncbi:MAG: cell surface protein SprA, partial [Desulfobulbaceae bacterium]|nr:cell surface protein SprA [Desulfobulbaceae bacterium]
MGAGILTRYKFYNGMDGNSPTPELSQEQYPTSASILPNSEDINRDNTLNKSESYYQYRVSMRPEDMRVGSNFIVDSIRATVKFANGDQSSVNWYQFKIPLTDYENVVGSIQDFKSIRFIRMFLNNFSDSVMLRFATLDLVRSDWRKYNRSLVEGQEGLAGPEPPDVYFDISAVNIEENAGKTPVNYVLPPGIDRVIDPTNPQLQELNEQSLVLKVENLPDGDARAAYKNLNLDIRQYRRIQLEVHAEALMGKVLNDRELSVFIRMGTDYKNNYYEYEIPLVVTPPGRYDNDKESERLIVWPLENRLDIDLDIFQRVKQIRNEIMRQPGSLV